MKTKLTPNEKETLLKLIAQMSEQSPSSTQKDIFIEALNQTGLASKLKPSSSQVSTYWQQAMKLKPDGGSPFDRIRSAERQIAEAIKDLDAERDRLQTRLLELDNLIAKYKKLT